MIHKKNPNKVANFKNRPKWRDDCPNSFIAFTSAFFFKISLTSGVNPRIEANYSEKELF